MAQKSSQLLNDILNKTSNKKILLEDFVNLLKQRSFALIILVFALAQTVLIVQPPGFSAVTGIPIALLGIQIMFGRKSIWLPKKIAKKEIPQKVLQKVIRWTLPIVIWCEKMTKPRWLFMFHPLSKRLLGLFIFTLALILSLPIPGGNILPGVAIALLAFSILQSDGILAFSSMIFSVLSIYFMYSLIVAATNIVINWVQTWF